MTAGMQKLFCLNIGQLGCRKFHPESKFLHQLNNSTSFLASLEELLTLLPFNKFLPNQVVESAAYDKSNSSEHIEAKYSPVAISNHFNTKSLAQANSIGLENRIDDKTLNVLKTQEELNCSVKIFKEAKDKSKQSNSFEMAKHFPSLVAGRISIQKKQDNSIPSTEAKVPASLEVFEQGEIEKNSATTSPLIRSKEKQQKLEIANHKDNIEQVNKVSLIGGQKATNGEKIKVVEGSKREADTESINGSNILRNNGGTERVERGAMDGALRGMKEYEMLREIVTGVEYNGGCKKEELSADRNNKAGEVRLNSINNEQIDNNSLIGAQKATKGEKIKVVEGSKREADTENISSGCTLRDNVIIDRIDKRASEGFPKVTRVYEIPAKIAAIVESAKEFPIKAEIVLHPKWLGTVIVEINVVKDNVEIMFNCENKEALHLLESNLVQLRERLQNLGFEKQYFSFQQNYEGGESFDYSRWNKQQKHEDESLRRQFLHTFLRNKEFDSDSFINEWGENVYKH
ncbi:MAG: flagellar hook-length control protein FliK [Candidatus Kapaibacteriota bacterium]